MAQDRDLMAELEVRETMAQSATHIRGEYDNIAVARKILALEDLAPGATTVAEACDALGVDLDAYLAAEEQAS